MRDGHEVLAKLLACRTPAGETNTNSTPGGGVSGSSCLRTLQRRIGEKLGLSPSAID
jgi:hypothetical protein